MLLASRSDMEQDTRWWGEKLGTEKKNGCRVRIIVPAVLLIVEVCVLWRHRCRFVEAGMHEWKCGRARDANSSQAVDRNDG